MYLCTPFTYKIKIQVYLFALPAELSSFKNNLTQKKHELGATNMRIEICLKKFILNMK